MSKEPVTTSLNQIMRGEGAEGKILHGLPHARELGIRVVSTGIGEAVLSIPYDTRLIGDPDTGVIHGGVVTTLLDTCCGVAGMNAASKPMGIATLDLRIDYMRPATPEMVLFAHAICYRETRSVAFLRATAFHESADDPIATAAGAFMITARKEKP